MKLSVATSVVKISRVHPRRNLPDRVACGQKEDNFIAAFGAVYIRQVISQQKGTSRLHAAGRELSIAGFGIADFVWIAWRKTRTGEKCTGLNSRSALPVRLQTGARPQKAIIFAFEMKLTNWRKALAQAFRYRYFSDAALVVLPPQAAAIAQQGLPLFRELQVGLWSFDEQTRRIHRIFTPRCCRPLSDSARQKAIALLSHTLKIPPVS